MSARETQIVAVLVAAFVLVAGGALCAALRWWSLWTALPWAMGSVFR